MTRQAIDTVGGQQPNKAEMVRIDANFVENYASIAAIEAAAEVVEDVAVRTLRQRVTIAEINAGLTLLAAVVGKSYSFVDCKAIAVGGAVGAVTTVDILGTQSSGVKLVAYAQAGLTQSAVLKDGGASSAVLVDGASYIANDANTAITIGKTGSDVTTATHVDVILQYTIN